MSVTFQPAFILHSRPYRETSLLLDVFTHDFGRIALICKGARKNRSPLKALLQPFNPLLISWSGKSELMTLTAAEADGLPFHLLGQCLLSGFYLNELLIRILHKQDPYPHLYTVYRKTLVELQTGELQQKTLRLFEKKLLEEIGYGLQLTHEFLNNAPIKADKYYNYYPEQGFMLHTEEHSEANIARFSGKSLLALFYERLEDQECLAEIKRLMRIVIAAIVGPKPLHSRKLFIEIEKNA